MGAGPGLTHAFSLSLSPLSLFFFLFPSLQFTSALKPLRSLPCPEKGLSPYPIPSRSSTSQPYLLAPLPWIRVYVSLCVCPPVNSQLLFIHI